MGGFNVASGWLTSILLALFVIASGWFTQILLALFVLCYSQWVAYVDFIGVICYSQWVACTDPLTLCVLASGWLAQFHLVSFSFISFTCCASGWYTQSLLLFLFFPFSTARWAALGLKRAAPKVCVFSCWDKLRFRGEWYFPAFDLVISRKICSHRYLMFI